MTPDGIDGKDWDRVHDLALRIVNASEADEEAIFRKSLLDYLAELRSRYGELPSILATEADYVDDPRASERLLLRGFYLARDRADLTNLLYIALSLGGPIRNRTDTAALAARGETLAAFDGRCILPGCVAPPSNTGRILGRRALPARRLARLGATPEFHHGLLGMAVAAGCS